MPQSAVVSLKVYDITGREYGTEIDNLSLNEGTFKFNFNAGELASGIYFYSLWVDNNKVATKKMVLIR
ncbi:MAG: T9SS type A sorting domain-containing protein [Chlorobi bacterium]|nr:T9SS type A sorting domain-containing protein [Chlorobiota bacterium]MCI0716849.1 T9SS type A sorting domain-containing protein [Chlorobiota bacterium]